MLESEEIDAADIEEVASILNTPSTLSQLKRMSKTYPSFAELASFLSNPTYKEYDVSSKLRVGQLRAQGSYADVYEGKLLTGITESALESLRGDMGRLRGRLRWGYDKVGFAKVAVKRIRLNPESERRFSRAIFREISIWVKLSHENILPLIGVALYDGSPSLVSQWMENGNLMQFLRRQERETSVASLALQIAKGLSYLHRSGVIHCDLKSGNILIGNDLRPMLCDFGISRLMIENEARLRNTSSKPMGSVRWMAIEVIHGQMDDAAVSPTKQYNSEASDIWSYGMVIYEMLTRRVPYFEVPNDAQVILEIISGGLPSTPPSIGDGNGVREVLWGICLDCWKQDPKQRPNMLDIIEELRKTSVNGDLTSRNTGTSVDSLANLDVREDKCPMSGRSCDKQKDSVPFNEIRIEGDVIVERQYTALTFTLSDSRYRQYNLTSRVMTGQIRANGYNTDILKGKFLRDADAQGGNMETRGLAEYYADNPSAFMDVAIKRFRISKWEPDSIKDILRELRIWTQLQHKNVLQFLGFTVIDGAFALITPWMERGDLQGYLKTTPNIDVYDHVLQIASGLAYLHGLGVVHADMRTSNILVSDDGRLLLTDFGISRLKVDGDTLTGASTLKGNVRWMAIELIEPGDRGHSFHTKQSDIWAFGMVVYELLSHEVPYHDCGNDMRVILSIVSGTVPQKPDLRNNEVRYADELWQICLQCWDKVPENRPSASSIVDRLQALCFPQVSTPSTNADENKFNTKTVDHPAIDPPRSDAQTDVPFFKNLARKFSPFRK